MILPQERQFGAVAKRGCIEALQEHFRRSEERDGLGDSSRASIAAVKSLMLDVVVAPILCGVEDPEWAGFLDCFAFTFGRSDIKLPAAEGGSFCLGGEGSRDDDGDGECSFCFASGSWRATSS